MKKLVIFFFFFVAISFKAFTQERPDEHLLDGTSMDYYYQNGTAVHVDFVDGQFKFKWIAGPNKGNEGSVEYRSRKIGDRQYMVNFLEKANITFVTIVFNFNQNMVSTSALIAGGTDQQRILFDGAIIEHLKLKEN
jgi:hypothetical protein